ncbi:hypothetical protein GCM10011380_14550 [Sphingomonas metalli]|uniref:Uncharacterized protein n=1 Tax=Sphingomonas metalli TaxID=1779358 RepID=A0A916T2L2_9SPHN|nr:hypothetical protein [Sphingomonas metalli]GGB26139.1 hypothetical protein GCM10011380_14550 [Sphingomonas metalli]
MSPEDRLARRRWLILSGIRVAGTAGAMLGMILAARAQTTGPKVLGVAIVLSALVMIALVPASLAHRWRSGRS